MGIVMANGQRGDNFMIYFVVKMLKQNEQIFSTVSCDNRIKHDGQREDNSMSYFFICY